MRAGFVHLGDVCTISGGYTPKPSQLFPEGDIPYFKVADMNRVGNEMLLCYTDQYLKEARKTFPKGAIVFPKNGGAVATNKKRILAHDAVVDLNTGIAIPGEKVDKQYLFYYFQGIDFKCFIKEGTLPVLRTKEIANLPFYFPPLPEQQRIVDILDKEFAKIDALKANAEKSLQAAKDLFQATLKKELEPRREMRNATLGDIISFERGLTYAKGDEVASSSVGVLRSNNVDLATQSLNLDEIKYLREDFEVPIKKKVKKSTLLMCMSNGSKDHLGKVALIDRDLDYAFGGFMGLLTPDKAKVFPKYLYYALSSQFFKDYIHSLADGANINNLKYKDLSIFRVALPSLAEQELSVSRLDELNGRCNTLQENYQKTLSLCDDLKQALLRKTFSGGL